MVVKSSGANGGFDLAVRFREDLNGLVTQIQDERWISLALTVLGNLETLKHNLILCLAILLRLLELEVVLLRECCAKCGFQKSMDVQLSAQQVKGITAIKILICQTEARTPI